MTAGQPFRVWELGICSCLLPPAKRARPARPSWRTVQAQAKELKGDPEIMRNLPGWIRQLHEAGVEHNGRQTIRMATHNVWFSDDVFHQGEHFRRMLTGQAQRLSLIPLVLVLGWQRKKMWNGDYRLCPPPGASWDYRGAEAQ